MEGFFALSCPPVKSARMRDLAARRIAKQFFQQSYAAMEGPALAGCEAMEPKGGTPERR